MPDASWHMTFDGHGNAKSFDVMAVANLLLDRSINDEPIKVSVSDLKAKSGSPEPTLCIDKVHFFDGSTFDTLQLHRDRNSIFN